MMAELLLQNFAESVRSIRGFLTWICLGHGGSLRANVHEWWQLFAAQSDAMRLCRWLGLGWR
jgi:hypothetical protein